MLRCSRVRIFRFHPSIRARQLQSTAYHSCLLVHVPLLLDIALSTPALFAMPHGTVSDVIPASASEVFQLLHDYDRRLEWDTLLQAAYLIDGAQMAALGVKSVCKGKTSLGGIALETEYVTFRPPDVAAVRMVNRPPFFDTFAATIRHTALTGHSSSIEYKYHFTARPLWLRFVLHPIMNLLFKWETRKRLAALQRYFASSKITAD